ncbi:major facilitator superfamily MFS_1 [Catenulispora acidiphila DSM 44928]|uniref:Major facilitator superfamily MFS_1 n=1 Tax=Catenulispora acidiphila (strain DSM 44928 / JCM 14897 / NBRC 102108 / NRRL B-24433 / ID139908) TaxID=479433 RepID=C7Q6T4_CATAD|nr:MFS transporter [Catenulispora acidiphila]ACU75947.1 major facilitator superfamily MFS_1 [Catenulispora acidiphila DSM 44928]
MRRTAATSLLLRHADFRRFYIGDVADQFGTSVTSVGVPLVAIATLHAGTFAVSLLSMAAWLPWLVIALPVGVWVDRTRHRPVMLCSAVVSGVLLASVPLVGGGSGGVGIGYLFAVTLLVGAASVFYQTAYRAYLPTLVAPEDLAEGNAKLHGSASAAQIVGRSGGGLFTQALGGLDVMFVNASTFVVSVFCLASIRIREARPVEPAERVMRREIADGLRLVARDPWIRTLTVFGAVSNLALMAYQSILPVFLIRDVGLSAGGVGLLVAAASSGGVCGAFLVRRVAGRVGTARTTLLFEVGLAVPAMLIALTTKGFGTLCYLVGAFCVSAGVVAGNVIKSGFFQAYCPPHLLGRVNASASFVNYGTLPLGALLGGVLGTLVGVPSAMWIATAGVPAAGLVLLLSPMRSVRDLPTAGHQVRPLVSSGGRLRRTG